LAFLDRDHNERHHGIATWARLQLQSHFQCCLTFALSGAPR
jgi:hypothetical protein